MSRDLARGVHALFDVDGQREEIGTIAGALAPVAVTRTTVSPIRAVIEPPASGANLPTSKVASLPSRA